MSDAARNLVLCFDGTGNVWKPGPEKTNVVKLVEALIQDHDRQLYYYDPGVGTPDGFVSEGLAARDLVARVSGLIWGGGVWRNVADGYEFAVTHYRPGDRIFVFGFSRGAFTARAVAGLIDMFGILRAVHVNLIPSLISIYKSGHEGDVEGRDKGESIRARFSRTDGGDDVHFIGVWDTVESVGLSQILLGTNITTTPIVKKSYRHVRHAVALDERRWPYEPRLYIPRKHREGDTFLQAGFRGAHSDVGGSYEESGLANETLHWIAREAYAFGLLLDLDLLDAHVGDPWAVAHDAAAGMPYWTVAGTFERELPETLFLHESVLYRACTELGKPVPSYEQRTKRVVHTRTRLVPIGATEPVERKVPRAAPSFPRYTSPGPWQWVFLVVLALAVVALAAWNRELQSALAMLQLGALQGELSESLAHWDRAMPVGIAALLCVDTLMIAAYAAWLPILQSFMLRLSARHGAARPWLGKVFCYGAGFLPLADLIENAATVALWRRIQATDSECLCVLWDNTLPVVLFLAAGAKFLLLAAVIGSVLSCLALAFTRSSTGLTAKRVIDRCVVRG